MRACIGDQLLVTTTVPSLIIRSKVVLPDCKSTVQYLCLLCCISKTDFRYTLY